MKKAPLLVIIGNGITGITAARTARKLSSDLRIQVLSDESDYFFSRTALMYIYMGHMRLQDTEPYERNFYKKNRIELIRGRVSKIDTKGCALSLEDGSRLPYDYLLIATGSRPNKFGWPGQDLKGVQGLYSLQDLESLEAWTGPKSERPVQQAVVVGGGLIGIELAEMLHSRHIPVTMLVRESSYWNNILPDEESALINQEIQRHGIDLRLQTELKEILSDEQGRARAVVTNKGDTIPSEFVGLTAGVSPNISVLDGSPIEKDRGVLVDRFLRTSEPRVYAAGDCAQFRNPDGSPSRRIEQLWYTGRMQGEVAGRQIAADALRMLGKTDAADGVDVSPYERGIWFNSAKFFTIEYQTYGFVSPKPASDSTFVWQDRNRNKLLRLVWQIAENGTPILTGMNSLGMRFRHEVFERWIAAGASIAEVVGALPEAAFDPEFSRKELPAIQEAFFEGGLENKQSAA